MLGRTHMAIGAAAACLLLPLATNTGHTAVWQELTLGHGHALIRSAAFVAATIMSSILPDLDESHSLLAQKVEMFGRLLLLLGLIGVIVTLHVHLSWLGWLTWGLFALSLLTNANWARKVALLVLAAGALYAASVLGVLSLAGGFGLTVWCVAAAFSAHRTWTHSLLGFACLIPAGLWLTHHQEGIWADGLLLGYTLHLIADSVAGGIPVLYPLARKRLGIRLVHTGSWVDHAIGALAIVTALGALWI